MLYLSTRNSADSYTAHRALHEARTPDGGFFVPFRLEAFSASELEQIKSLSACEAIAKVLNLFFGVNLTGWDVECVVGRSPLKPVVANQRLVFAEGWRNPEGSFRYLLAGLHSRMTGRNDVTSTPSGWAYVAIEIALLFGVYASMDDYPAQGMDIAVTTGDFSDIAAIVYAKQMGLPFGAIICATNENSAGWDFITKGELNTNSAIVKTELPQLDVVQPEYLECLLYAVLGTDAAKRYAENCEEKCVFRVDAEQHRLLCADMYCAVVSANRAASIVSGVNKASGYTVDPYAALVYGGLLDYRARTGVNKDTLFLIKYRPAPEKE